MSGEGCVAGSGFIVVFIFKDSGRRVEEDLLAKVVPQKLFRGRGGRVAARRLRLMSGRPVRLGEPMEAR
jgi:hypothetical protein